MAKKIIFVFFLFCTIPFSKMSCFAEYKYNLSICTIFRDEAPYLKEWIEFHRMLGVEHFYLCSHASQDNYKEVLSPYINCGIVELKEIEDLHPDGGLHYFLNGFQNAFFNETILNASEISKWVAFIDADEFLYPLKHDSLNDILQNFEEYGSVSVNWQMFGTSGIQRLDSNKTMIEQLIRCALVDIPCNFHVKSIVRADRSGGFSCPHWSHLLGNYQQVNTDKVSFIGPFSPYVQVNELRINHYWTRDEYYLNKIKIPRQISFGNPPEVVYRNNVEFSQTMDLSIQRFVPELKKRMELN